MRNIDMIKRIEKKKGSNPLRNEQDKKFNGGFTSVSLQDRDLLVRKYQWLTIACKCVIYVANVSLHNLISIFWLNWLLFLILDYLS